mgnify:CR=1 FL=1
MRDLIRKILREQVGYSNFCLPINGWHGTLSPKQKFRGVRSKHNGADLGNNSGDNLYAPEDGIVEKAKFHTPWDNSLVPGGTYKEKKVANKANGWNACGGFIKIKHDNNITTKYCHLKQIDVKPGDPVVRGQIIGLTGGDSADKGRGNSSHSHLHYEVLVNGSHVNPEPDFLRNGECGGVNQVDDLIVIDDKDKRKKEKQNKYHDGNKAECRGVLSTQEVRSDTLKLMKIYTNGFILDDNGEIVHELKFTPNSIENMDRGEVNAKGIELYATYNGLTDDGDDISIANGNIWVDCRLNSVVFDHINDNDIVYG